MDMLRFLIMKEVRGSFRRVLNRHPDFEEDIRSVRQAESFDFKLRKINLLNRADVLYFIAQDSSTKRSDLADSKTDAIRETGKVKLTFVDSTESIGKSIVKSVSSKMRPEQAENTCWKIYRRDQTITP